MGKGPIDFRCDKMRVLSKPNRILCVDHVVVRRDNLLLCCEEFEGIADDAWVWQRYICRRHVRAQRPDEMMWSDNAEYLLNSGLLVLTGEPLLQRGQSLVAGTRIVAEVEHDQARIEEPRGHMEPGATAPKTPVPGNVPALSGPLPAQCPLPSAPVRALKAAGPQP